MISIPPPGAALDTKLMGPHGCHRTAGRRVFITGGYQPSSRRNSSARLLKRTEDKRNYGDEAFLIIGIIGSPGLQGRAAYSVLENPRELISNPAVLISRLDLTVVWLGSYDDSRNGISGAAL